MSYIPTIYINVKQIEARLALIEAKELTGSEFEKKVIRFLLHYYHNVDAWLKLDKAIYVILTDFYTTESNKDARRVLDSLNLKYYLYN